MEDEIIVDLTKKVGYNKIMSKIYYILCELRYYIKCKYRTRYNYSRVIYWLDELIYIGEHKEYLRTYNNAMNLWRFK